MDRLSIGKHDDQQDGGDDEGNRAGRAEGGRAGQDQDAQDFFRGVGDGRQCIG
jgi:hypothetical protein